MCPPRRSSGAAALGRPRPGAGSVKPVPEGFRAVEPYLPVRGRGGLIDFLKQAFGAEEVLAHQRPDGHCPCRGQDRRLDSRDGGCPTEFPAMPTAIHLYVGRCRCRVRARAARRRDLDAGAGRSALRRPRGRREGSVRQPLVHRHAHGEESAGQAAQHIPEGLHAITPYLHPHGAPSLIDFLKRAFGAEEAFRARAPDGTVVHAKIRIGESISRWARRTARISRCRRRFTCTWMTRTRCTARLRAGGESLSEPADQPTATAAPASRTRTTTGGTSRRTREMFGRKDLRRVKTRAPGERREARDGRREARDGRGKGRLSRVACLRCRRGSMR